MIIAACGLSAIGALSAAMVRASAAGHVTRYRGAQVHSLWKVISPRPPRRDGVMAAELNALRSARANVLRVDVSWASLEVRRNRYDAAYLQTLDLLARGAASRGIKLLATLWWTPRWASAGGAWNDPPSDPRTYGDFARFITARYGSELAGVEAWNEPNRGSNLIAQDVPGVYAEMLKAFYRGAKQGDASVQVLAGGMSYADLGFLGALYHDGIKGSYDAISMHPYADGAPPENTRVTHSFLGGIETLHRFQQANGDGTPEWLTEFGWPVGTSPGANTEAQQARYIERAFALTNRIPYVVGAIVYQLRDPALAPADPEDNFGLLRADLTPRPAFAAFRRALQRRAP